MRFWRWLALALGAVLALALVAAAALLLFVDPDRFRGQLEARVSAASGRELRLREPLELELFPWLALRTGRGELADPPGFDGGADPAPFARWRAARLGVRLGPLLGGRLIVDRVRLEGLELSLRRSASGAANWEGFAAQGDAAGGGRLRLESLAGLALREGALRYRDAASGLRVELTDWRLEAGPWKPGAPLELDTAFTLALPRAGEHARIALEAVGVPSAKAFALRVPHWQAQIGASHLQGDLEARVPRGDAAAGPAAALAAASAAGSLKISSPSLRALLAAAGVDAPPTRDPQALGDFALETGWRLTDGTVHLEALALQLDETKLGGTATMPLGEGGVVRFALAGDHMNLTRYLDPEGAPREPFELPTAALEQLRAAGELRLASAQLAEVRLKGVRLELVLDEGKLRSVPQPEPPTVRR